MSAGNGHRKPLTATEIADRLGVSENLIYGWVTSGEPVDLRLGGKGMRGVIRIEPEALEAFVVLCRHGGRNPGQRARQAGTFTSPLPLEI